VDAEMEDNTFIWHPESNFVHITLYIFRKQKRTREEDVEEEQNQVVLFEVRGLENPPSFLLMML
jgi:hypothetical protein